MDLPDSQQHTRDERHPVDAVVPNRQRLAQGAEEHLLMCDQPSETDRVNRGAVDIGPTGALQAGAGGIGVGRQSFPRLGDETSGPGRRTRWGVSLLRMV